MGLLLTGKVALEDAALIEELQRNGLAEKNTVFSSHSFEENKNTNDKLEFLF